MRITIQTVQDKMQPEKKRLKKKSDTRVSCIKSIRDSSMDIRDKRKSDRCKVSKEEFCKQSTGVIF